MALDTYEEISKIHEKKKKLGEFRNEAIRFARKEIEYNEDFNIAVNAILDFEHRVKELL